MHHPEDLAGSVRYINTLTDAVRRTGCRKLIFYNVSQDFRIGEAIRRSKAQGVSFGWYPTGLNAGYELRGNYLRGVDEFPDMLRPELAGLPRIVYEFDSPDLRNATMYPAMVRTFRRVGAQFAAMFAYDMLQTASRNLGWQTHYLNLVYTPRKAMSAVIAAEAMRRLPRMPGLRALPPEHPVRRFPHLGGGGSGGAGRGRRLPLRRFDPLGASGPGGPAARRGLRLLTDRDLRGRGGVFPRPRGERRLAAGGVSRRGADPGPLRAAEPG